MILIDYKDTRPLYEQVIEKFKLLILNEVLEVDEKLPSVRSLAVELSINPNTIQRAYSELERQGYIYTVKGRGNFVSDKSKLVSDCETEVFLELEEMCNKAITAGVAKEKLIKRVEKYYLANLEPNKKEEK